MIIVLDWTKLKENFDFEPTKSFIQLMIGLYGQAFVDSTSAVVLHQENSRPFQIRHFVTKNLLFNEIKGQTQVRNFLNFAA